MNSKLNKKIFIVGLIIFLLAVVGWWKFFDNNKNGNLKSIETLTVKDIDVLFGQGDIDTLKKVALEHSDPYIKERALLSAADLLMKGERPDELQEFLQTASNDQELRQIARVNLSYLQESRGVFDFEVVEPGEILPGEGFIFKIRLTSQSDAEATVVLQDFLYKDDQGRVIELASGDSDDFPLQDDKKNKQSVSLSANESKEVGFPLTFNKTGKYRFIVRAESFFPDKSQVLRSKAVILSVGKSNEGPLFEVVDLDSF